MARDRRNLESSRNRARYPGRVSPAQILYRCRGVERSMDPTRAYRRHARPRLEKTLDHTCRDQGSGICPPKVKIHRWVGDGRESVSRSQASGFPSRGFGVSGFRGGGITRSRQGSHSWGSRDSPRPALAPEPPQAAAHPSTPAACPPEISQEKIFKLKPFWS